MRESGTAEINRKTRIIRALMENYDAIDSAQHRMIQKGTMPEPSLAFHHQIKLIQFFSGKIVLTSSPNYLTKSNNNYNNN